jgi:hypothetical protein
MATFDEQGREILQSLDDTTSRVKTDVVAVLEQVETANRSLRSVVDQAGGNLSRIERGLNEQTGDLRLALDRVVADTTASSGTIAETTEVLREVSRTVLADIGAIATSLAEQTGDLQSSARALSSVGGNLQGIVGERLAALDGVLSALQERTETMSEGLQTIATNIQDTLSNAERRARDVGYQLARNAETAMNGVTHQLEQLSVSAEEEGRKTQQTVERVRGELISEINASIGSAVDRFAGATEEMRKATRAVGREIDEIRADLSRGVLDLPEETSQHAAAMRRVVSEQIRALNELSEIVSRQAPSQAFAEAPARAQASGPSPALAARSLPAQKSQPAEPPRAFSRQPANQPPRPATIERRPETRQQPVAEERSERSSERSSGWISDLLRRVSDEDSPSPRLPSSDRGVKGSNPLDGLGSLTSDIARSIDPDAYADLWDRYRRGDGNVFTRRVYTLQGQQTFDEVRRRYGREADFREAVDRYIDHFSALYEEAVQKDPNGRLAENYLNSDTGKVYTLLAHASGKLG